MRNDWLTVVLVIVVSAILFIVLNFNGESPVLKSEPQKLKTVSDSAHDMQVTELADEPVALSSSLEQSKESKAVTEPSDSFKERFIEAKVLFNKFGSCVTLSALKEIKKRKYTPLDRLNPVQKEYFDKVAEDCENILANEYPHIRGELHDYLFQIEKQSKVESDSGYNFLNQYTPLKLQDMVRIVNQIASEHPDLLAETIMNLIYRDSQGGIIAIKELIGGEDVGYQYFIKQFASHYLACSKGADCGSLSQIMFVHCSYEANFCVGDFMELYNTRLTVGVKADVQLVVNYYKEIFELD